MGTHLLTHEIRLSQTFAASSEDVWRALTDSRLVAQWLMSNDLEACASRRFTFRSEPQMGWDGEVRCEVRDVWPLKRFSYSWIGGADMPETVVTWSLESVSGGTCVTLVHSGFRGMKYSIVGRILERGWKRMMAEDLPKVLAAVKRPSAAA